MSYGAVVIAGSVVFTGPSAIKVGAAAPSPVPPARPGLRNADPPSSEPAMATTIPAGILPALATPLPIVAL